MHAPWEGPSTEAKSADAACGTCSPLAKAKAYAKELLDDARHFLTPHGMTPEQVSDQKRLDALLKKKQSGQRFNPADRAFLEVVAARADKGLVTFAAGGAILVKQARGMGPGASTPLIRQSFELNTDHGAAYREERWFERHMPGGGKLVTYVEATPGTEHEHGVIYEQTIREIGNRNTTAEGKLEAIGRYSPTTDGAAVGLKAKIAKELSTPVGSTEFEGYAQVEVNRLSVEEQQALSARIMMHADDAQGLDDARQENKERFLQNLDAARAEDADRRARERADAAEAGQRGIDARATELRDAALEREQRWGELEIRRTDALNPKPTYPSKP